MEMKTFQISLTPNIGLKIENFLHLKIDDFSGLIFTGEVYRPKSQYTSE